MTTVGRRVGRAEAAERESGARQPQHAGHSDEARGCKGRREWHGKSDPTCHAVAGKKKRHGSVLPTPEAGVGKWDIYGIASLDQKD